MPVQFRSEGSKQILDEMESPKRVKCQWQCLYSCSSPYLAGLFHMETLWRLMSRTGETSSLVCLLLLFLFVAYLCNTLVAHVMSDLLPLDFLRILHRLQKHQINCIDGQKSQKLGRNYFSCIALSTNICPFLI